MVTKEKVNLIKTVLSNLCFDTEIKEDLKLLLYDEERKLEILNKEETWRNNGNEKYSKKSG